MKRICALLLFFTACIANTADAATAVPTGTTSITIYNSIDEIPAGEKINVTSSVYVGYTESFAESFAEFLSNINAISDPNAIIGIDSTRPTANRTVSDSIDQTRLNDFAKNTSYYIGTTSNITLTGVITPTLMGDKDLGTLHLAALGDGYLNVSSQLGATSPVDAVVIGRSDLTGQGTVELAGSNSYGGGTKVLGGTLFVSNNNALGATTGAVTVASGATLNLGSDVSISLYNPVLLEPGSTITGYGNYYSHIALNTGVNLVPGGFGQIGEIHFHGESGATSINTSLTIEAGSIWHIDLSGTNNDTICAWYNVDILGNRLVPIVINLYSVNGETGNGFGPLLGFDPTQAYKWIILYRSSSITGFDPNYFYINTEDLFAQNPNLAGLGDFDIEQIGNSLAITFTPVPEPGTYALMGAGLALLALGRWRKRRAAR